MTKDRRTTDSGRYLLSCSLVKFSLSTIWELFHYFYPSTSRGWPTELLMSTRAGGSNSARTRTVVLGSFFFFIRIFVSVVLCYFLRCFLTLTLSFLSRNLSARLYLLNTQRRASPGSAFFCQLWRFFLFIFTTWDCVAGSCVQAFHLDPQIGYTETPGKSNNRLSKFPPFFSKFLLSPARETQIGSSPRQIHPISETPKTNLTRHDDITNSLSCRWEDDLAWSWAGL